VSRAPLFPTFALALALASAHAAHADVPGTDADAAAIRAIVADLDRAWAESDADRWASHYRPDAEFINILGMVMPDLAAMRARHHEILQGVFKGSHHAGTLRKLRFLTADVAIADVDIEVTQFKALPPGARPTEPGVLRTRMRHVLQRLDGQWWIVATQNTALAPAP
jgi:uncharacterized protein (TIGR02246 family)